MAIVAGPDAETVHSLFGGLSTFQRTMALLSEKMVFDRPIVVTNVE